jgi:trehalose 6-phosphate phosphatase
LTAGDRLSEPRCEWAYFLDVDGTLVDLAPSPAESRLLHHVRESVQRLHEHASGALALVSGRSIDDVDALFADPALAVAGQHGLERRDARGVVTRHSPGLERLQIAKRRLTEIVAVKAGLVLEDKGLTLALHYRGAPSLASFAHRTMRAVRAQMGGGYAIQCGKRVVELKPGDKDKGTAVAEFMAEEPFIGRLAVFIGDDATDERGFAAVNALGGHSIKVGRGPTVARWRLRNVQAVHSWLEGGRRGTQRSALHAAPAAIQRTTR